MKTLYVIDKSSREKNKYMITKFVYLDGKYKK